MVHECDDEELQRLRFCFACKKALREKLTNDPSDWFFKEALDQMQDGFAIEDSAEPQLWDIYVKHPMRMMRLGTVKRDLDRGVLIVQDEDRIQEIPLRDVIQVEKTPNKFENAPDFGNPLKAENAMKMLEWADEQGDPKWMVPVIFDAPDEQTARNIQRTIDMLVKHGARDFADMHERGIHAFGLMRYSMFHPEASEFVTDERKSDE